MNTRKYLRYVIPVSIGALGGFLYYNFIGCYSGSCPITGDPLVSTLYGGLIGFLFTGFKAQKREMYDNEN